MHPSHLSVLRLKSLVRSTSLLHLASALSTTSSIITIEGAVRYEEVIKKSRFISFAAPVVSAAEATEFVRSMSDPKCSHNCFAWRLSCGSERNSGDGEPGGTAGPPILAAITGAGLHDVVVLVQRHYGGIKLGTGGLVRAYGGAAAKALSKAVPIEVEATTQVFATFQARDTGAVYMTLAKYKLELIEPEFEPAGDELTVAFSAPPHELDVLSDALMSATQGRVSIMK